MIAFGTHSVSVSPGPGTVPAAPVADNAYSAARPSPVEQLRAPDTATPPEPAPSIGTTLHDELIHHLQPVGTIEQELVRQLAQVTADLRTYESARDTAIVSGYSMFSNLFESMTGMAGTAGEKPCVPGVSGEAGCTRDVPPLAGSAESPDMALVSAIKSDPVRHCERTLAAKQRRFLTLLKTLERQQKLRQAQSLPRLAEQARITVDCVPDDRISDDHVSVDATTGACVAAETQEAGHWLPVKTEAECEALFRAWRRTARLPCPHCGSRELPLELTGRRVLQCRGCEGQFGLRHGTMIAKKKISFRAFVHAVRLLAHTPMTSREALRQATGLCRRTLTKLAAVIHEALADPVRRYELFTACGWRQEQE